MNSCDISAEDKVGSAPVRRVRDEVKDGVAVAAASVGASVVLVAVATLLMKLAG